MPIAAIQPGFPDAAEYPASVADYIGLTRGRADPVGGLKQQGAEFAQFCVDFDPALRLHRYEPGKWSIQQMLGHITDTERVFAYRALRIARGDGSPNPPFEQDEWIAAAAHEDAPWPDLEEFRSVRASTRLLLGHLPADAWLRSGQLIGGSITARALARAILGHLEHHRDLVNQRYF